MSKITLNIVEPGSSTPVDSGINPAVPNTGLFTHGIGGPEATIITVSIVAVLAAVAAVLYYRKKHNKKSKLTDVINAVKPKKQLSIPLVALALVVSLGTLAGLLVNAGKSNTNAADGSLTVTESSEDLTIEVGDEPVFAVLPVELTVAEATDAGYTLTAYTDSTDIVSTTNPDNVIPMIAASEDLSVLTDNTWGLSLEQPQDENSQVYTTLSTDQSNPTILKTIDDYSETEANDTTTIYYGFYITPDVPYGTYEGGDIAYVAEPNYITTLSFDGNGSDGGEAMDSIIVPAGTAITLPENTYTKDGYHFTGWNTEADGAGEAYAEEAEYAAIAGESVNVTLYAQWEEDVLYMQDVAKWGSTLSVGDEAIAVDNRDDKEYYVARLADGNIWMTQNLDLNLISDPTAEGYVALTPANTNITADWTPANSTISFTGTSVPGWQDDHFVLYSADPGPLYVYSSGTTSKDEQYTSLEACEEAHSDCSAKNHVGNYYNWSAAVAMNDTSEITERYTNIKTSICPAGWKLPTGRDSDDTAASREWNAVLYAEGVASSPTGNGYTSDGLNKIRTAPLWLARSGCVSSGGSFGDTGYGAYYWSSTVYASYGAYTLSFDPGSVYPANFSGRYNGLSVRCVAQ